MSKGYPIFKGYVTKGRDAWVFQGWCPFCHRWHTHGAGPVSDPESPKRYMGHRLAHCFVKDSPFNEKGYLIKLFSKREMADLIGAA